MNLKIVRNDGRTPNPRIATGEMKFVTQGSKYVPSGKYRLVLPHEIKDFAAELMQHNVVAVDSETTGLNWQNCHIIGLSFAMADVVDEKFKDYKAFYVTEQFEEFDKFFADTSIDKIFHNAKFDLHMLMNAGLMDEKRIVETNIWDTMLMHYLLDENSRHALKDISKRLIDPEADKLEKLLKEFMKANNCTSYAEVPLDLLTDYAAADTDYTFQLYNMLLPQLIEQKMTEPVAEVADGMIISLHQIESMLCKELLFQERHGVLLDKEYILNYIADMEAELKTQEEKVMEILGHPINIGSSEELYEEFIKLGVSKDKFQLTEKEKKPKVNVDAFELFLDIYKDNTILCDFIKAVQTLKDTEKQLNTYLVNFREMMDDKGYLHTQFNQHIARTGRLSSSEPNLQNIPKVYKRMRKCFKIQEGWNIVFFDYSQVEMRIFADYANDPVMLKAINDGRDLHSETIRNIRSIPLEKWVEEENAETDYYKEQRAMGKTTNFGIVYGMGKKKTSDKLKLTKWIPVYQKQRDPVTQEWKDVRIGEDPDYREGMKFLNSYYEMYPGVQMLMNQAKQVINVRGFIRNKFNRRRRLTKQESYKAVNSLVQGCSADIIKVAMIRVAMYLRMNRLKSRLVNNIHDELWLYVPDSELHIIPVVKRLVETWNKPTFQVPLACDVEISNTNWGEKKHLSSDSRSEVIKLGEQITKGEY